MQSILWWLPVSFHTLGITETAVNNIAMKWHLQAGGRRAVILLKEGLPSSALSYLAGIQGLARSSAAALEELRMLGCVQEEHFFLFLFSSVFTSYCVWSELHSEV